MSSSPAVANLSAGCAIDTQKTVPNTENSANTASADDNPLNDDDNNDSNTEGGLSKKQRGRIKKLCKRARVLRTGADLSGICKREEWIELQEMFSQEKTKNDSSSFCPWIGNRNTKKSQQRTEEGRILEAVDQRLILKRLHCQESLPLHSTILPGKRKRSPEATKDEVVPMPIPSWATLHNSACVDHVAVLEVHIPFRAIQKDKISMEQVDAVITQASYTAAHSTMATSWFQGPRVQSISDALLYEKPNRPNQQSKKKTKSLDNKDELVETLQSMTLSSEQWEREGYPIRMQDAKPNEQKDDKATCKRMQVPGGSFRPPSSFTLEEAQAMVHKAQVYVKDKLFPFVVDCDSVDSSSSDEPPRIFGMDCEMVETKMGRELARITLIQYTGESNTINTGSSFENCYKVLMDDLVLPYDPILDYVTAYSGMTAKLLSGVATRLEHIQASLLHYICGQDIVVGHSLENDLKACRWIHPNVLDTAVVFRSSGSFKHSLKHLSNVLLQKKIQGDSHHCSEEDAAAALELAIRRAQEGDSFAIYSNQKKWWIQSGGKNNNNGACVFVGPSEWLQAHVTNHPNAIHALSCESIDSPNRKAILSWLTGPKRKAALVWAHLVVETAEHLRQLEDLLKEIQSKMTPNTVLMVNTQCGFEQASSMAKNRRIARNPRTTMGWTDDQELKWKEAVERCRDGKTFWITTKNNFHVC